MKPVLHFSVLDSLGCRVIWSLAIYDCVFLVSLLLLLPETLRLLVGTGGVETDGVHIVSIGTTISTQSVIMIYLVDIFPGQSAAASARCLFVTGVQVP